MDSVKSAADAGNTATAQLHSGEEPLSGVSGKGTVGEPYDQGNAEGSEGKSAEEKPMATLDAAKNTVSEAMTGKGT